MRIFAFILPWAAIGIVLAVAAAGAARGTNVFKKQGVAWVITAMMIVAAIGIGRSTASIYNHPEPEPYYPSETIPPVQPVAPAAAESYVWDNARVLSEGTVRELDERNDRLWNNYSASIGVVTCNYGEDDLYSYALQCAEDMSLGGYDFTVVLDISGENYWLVQGNDLRRDFTDNMCSDYAYDYLERDFARGDYDSALLALTKALEDWYGVYYF